MKKLSIISAIIMMMASCVAPKYYFAQVLKTECANRSEKLSSANNEVMYEDQNCVIFYNMWSEYGNGGFGIYNKTDKLLYINLAKTFFICNGISHPYYKARAWSSSASSSSQVSTDYSSQAINSVAHGSANGSAYVYGGTNTTIYPYSFNTIGSAQGNANVSASAYSHTYAAASTTFTSNYASNSSSLSVSEMPELAIAPKSSIWINEYAISDRLIVDCDLVRFPETSASMDFTPENSPIKFGNYITYYMEGSEQENIVKNDFYVSQVTNYAWPSLFEYVEKVKPCQNTTDDPAKHYSTKYPYKVYNRCYKIDCSNSFKIEYEVNSYEKLYKTQKTYYYNTAYDGYVSSGF